MKPGYCLDPLESILISDEPESLGLASRLYAFVEKVDRMGQKRDFENALDELTSDMRYDGMGWYLIAISAYRVKLYKAWEKQYSSFREYCEVALGRTVATINNWIRGARVVSELIASGQTKLPQSSSIAIELSKLEEGGCLLDTWRDLCDRIPEHQINLEKLRNLMNDPTEQKPKTKRVQVDQDDWELLREVAASGGLSPSQLLKQLIRGIEQPIEAASEEKIDYFPEAEPEEEKTEPEKKHKREKPKGFGIERAEPLADLPSRQSAGRLHSAAAQSPPVEVEIIDDMTEQQKIQMLDEMGNDPLPPSVEYMFDLEDDEDDEDDDDYIYIAPPDTTDYEPPYIKKEEPPEADEILYDYDPDDDYDPDELTPDEVEQWAERGLRDEEPLLCEAKKAKSLNRIKDYFWSTFKNAWCAVMPSGHVIPLSEWVEVF